MRAYPTRRQWQILDAISDSMKDRGYPPTVREIGEVVGLSSSSSVYYHLCALEGMGMIEYAPGKARTLRLAL